MVVYSKLVTIPKFSHSVADIQVLIYFHSDADYNLIRVNPPFLERVLFRFYLQSSFRTVVPCFIESCLKQNHSEKFSCGFQN